MEESRCRLNGRSFFSEKKGCRKEISLRAAFFIMQ
jgi:hypothetical protein